jgi:hypothetical protein
MGMTETKNQSHYCFCIASESLGDEERKKLAGQKAAVLKNAQWPKNAEITVRFLEGNPALQERVKKVASEWVAPNMAHLTLTFKKSGDANIRIAFQQGDGSWSYLGTVCRSIPEPQPTMNYGWLTPDSSDDELRRVVLHEFGHALGLIHEHQNPKEPIRWNRDAVIRDLSRPPNSWDLATIENNMFKKYAKHEVLATPVDADSIMMYMIPAAWTEKGYFSADLNSDLSERDRELIREAYPRT